MKKIIKVLIIFICLFNIVKAKRLVTFSEAINGSSNFLSNINNYSQYIYSTNYLGYDGTVKTNASVLNDSTYTLTNVGLLNPYEYKLSFYNSVSYLYHSRYWTMKQVSSGNYYVIEENNSTGYTSYSTSSTNTFNVRYTMFFNRNVVVSGSGDYSDPIVVLEKHKVTFVNSNITFSNGGSTFVDDGYTAETIMTIPSGYSYKSNDCNATVSGSKITITNVTSDITCNIELQ